MILNGLQMDSQNNLQKKKPHWEQISCANMPKCHQKSLSAEPPHYKHVMPSIFSQFPGQNGIVS